MIEYTGDLRRSKCLAPDRGRPLHKLKMAAAQMMSVTNMKSVLDDMFEKKESELYSNIASANVDQKLALVDFFKEL